MFKSQLSWLSSHMILLSFFIYSMQITSVIYFTELLGRVNQMKHFKQGHTLNIQEIGSCCSYDIDLSLTQQWLQSDFKPVVLKQMCLTKNTKNTCTTYKNITYIPYLILRFVICRREEGRYRHTELENDPPMTLKTLF